MSLGRALLLALALPLAAGTAGTGESGTLDPAGTGGATGPLLGALKHVQLKHERACLAGIKAWVNIYVDPNKGAVKEDPRCHPGSFNEFSYLFYSPDKPRRIIVMVNQPIGSGPICMAPLYGHFDDNYPGDDPTRGERVPATCIADFSVDTAKALAVAGANGLGLGTTTTYLMRLVYAETGTEPDWKDKLLRRKVFWVVSVDPREHRNVREYLVDAQTGAFLKSRPGTWARGAGPLKY
ncbi:MAG: hypothetical protein M0D55_15210 [Elusimicrobiota bacterium]|nr:MAG: hypothetical protein M0D55_15210 [Elusimicrobiota bacterium]